MKKILLCFIAVIFCVIDVYAQIAMPNPQNSDNPQSIAKTMMSQYDFNGDGKINEKEFIVGDGDSGYRAHLSNIHKGLELKNITIQQYWFIEMINPKKYKEDLSDYFTYMDKDGDGYISVSEYEDTFKGKYPPDAGKKYSEIIDVNRDNLISKAEYINFDFTTFPSGSHEVFQNIDANHDKVITFDEIKHLFDYFSSSW